MWVKICGITDVATAAAVIELAPDAIGLNFYAASPRCVSPVEAVRMGRLLPRGVTRVGVFVNHTVNEIEDLVKDCLLDQIQLHGDESPDQLAVLRSRLPQVPLIRAWRMAGESLADLEEYLKACQELNVSLAACLIDARVAGVYGGSGHTVAWDALARVYPRNTWPPLILAGGLTPDNAADAVCVTQPWGVDVASGVESQPGVKDLKLVRRFIANARSA